MSNDNRTFIAHPLLRARDWQHREQLDRVCQWWRDGGSGVCALIRIGGAGKTVIAARFLQRLPGVLPVDAAGREQDPRRPWASGQVTIRPTPPRSTCWKRSSTTRSSPATSARRTKSTGTGSAGTKISAGVWARTSGASGSAARLPAASRRRKSLSGWLWSSAASPQTNWGLAARTSPLDPSHPLSRPRPRAAGRGSGCPGRLPRRPRLAAQT